MSDLQMSLIIIGIIVIAGVAIFNWLQQLRYRRKVQAAFDHKHDDILLDPHHSEESTQRIEPKFNKTPVSDDQFDILMPDDLPAAHTDTKKPFVAPNPSIHISTHSSATSPILDYDNVTNYIVNIRSESIIANTYIAKLLQRKFDFGKSVCWLGQRHKDEAWEEITNESNVESDGYICLKGCLQLADRAGPISEVNLSKFRDLVQDFATQVHATADCPDIVATHEKAVILDKFCAEVDVMIGINIISKDDGAFVGTKIRALAEASGFKLESDGLFKYRDDSNNVLFTLSNYESPQFLSENMKSLTTHGVTFLLDVPRVAHGERVFDQMTHLAKIFSNTLGGILVDDNRVPLSDSGIQKSKQQLVEIQSLMKKNHINAGSASALRLFV
ncbi:MAG TPA: cell division protein ZipA C-terminal FtsZ-binding domain-containing protein [Nitrosomonas sp.]|jgi:FtsZ-interacting cell division protein ZipA|nr:cell division protein ZipA C-terminal FtsZ-binding domain-containing protein [Nitrosomonas sp.]MBP6355079.1 cell division protein ZipA C-terminal FtsZ-binding domain-containing protein [Nitrosomonas sp.]HQV89738.1 cell division protein ZipA C-terminal FtsZ-binding domain-containing protein [Nitrosomonas sp.]HRB96742.1 cell division protein ZipA C-terminal FtsZ-binding domain-containing protein [Nitrosomonas sp.]